METTTNEKRLRIIRQILKILAAEKCTVAEARALLSEVEQVMLLTAPISEDWPQTKPLPRASAFSID